MGNSIRAGSKPLKTRRKSARYADRVMVGETPVALIKSAKNEDFLTAEEFIEDLYGKKVKKIEFEEPIA